MSSTTVAQHTTQPLNFGPEWLRALSTPETTTTPIASSGGSTSGNAFKFGPTKYRYSKEEILALRTNVTERLAEEVRNEIMENLRDVESVFRPNIIEPLTLTAPTGEEATKLSSLSSYISGRTPGGGGRGGHNSQQSQSSQQQQSHDSRPSRGGSSMSNGRGGNSRGRGGRDNAFGSNRGNNSGEDQGENGAGGDDPSASSSWSRGTGGYHPRGGGTGGSFSNRIRSYDDRDPAPSFRRGGGGGGTRQTSDTWRRPRADDDDNNDQNEDPTSANGSSSWTTRGGQSRRGGSSAGGGSIEHRTKSNDKLSHSDDRPGQSNSFESNQSRTAGAWRNNSTMSDRDLNARRPQGKRDRMPEWMDDNNDADGQLSGATFDTDGTFTGPPATRSKATESSEPQKLQSQSSTEEVPVQPVKTAPPKPPEESKVEKLTPPRTDTAVVNKPSAPEANVSKPTPPVQQPVVSWDDEFEPSDVATTVVEATLAEDHDYSPPISTHLKAHALAMEPTPPAVPLIPQTQRLHSAPVPVPPAPVIDDKQWFYRDPQNTVQGPFSSADMERWFAAGYFTVLLPVKRLGETQFSTIQQLIKEMGRLPFRSDAPSLPSTPSIPIQQQSSIVSEPQKYNPLAHPASSTGSSAYLEDFLMQQQRQNLQHSMLFNRQVSMPTGTTDRKVLPASSASSSSIMSPQMQSFFASQQQPPSQQPSASSLFSSTLVNDPGAAFQQHVPQLQRSISATNQQPGPSGLYDDMQRSFPQIPSSSNSSAFFATNMPLSNSQQAPQSGDIMARLAQAMQSHGQQQQEKVEEQRRLEQQRRELEMERLRLTQQAEQLRLQREEDERRRLEHQKKLDEELLKKQEATLKKQMILEQMKEMTKVMDQKKTQQAAPVTPPVKSDIDPFLAFQQSVQFQKEQQAKIEAQKAENIRRYQQQQLRDQSHSSPSVQQQQTFKLPETANWARHASQSSDQASQPLNFAEIQKQEQEQERRAREAAMAAQNLAKSDALNIPNSSSSSSGKPGSWARTLFAGSTPSGNTNPMASGHPSTADHDTHESSMPESPISSYNQQATNAVLSLLNIHPKSRSSTHQQSAPWSAASSGTQNTSLQDIQRQQQQQSQNEPKAQTPAPSAAAHSSSSAPAWGGIFSQPTASAQSSSIFWGESTSNPSTSSNKSSSTSGNKSATPWSDAKSSSATGSSSKSTSSHNNELSKSEREAKHLFTTTRTQDALSKWTQTQFKDNSQAIDVPTLVQLLKDIDSAEEIVEYVQPYIGSVIKAREFAQDFITKRKQLANAEPELDNERLNALAMAPTSSNANSGNAGDEGFQLASNGQKKKAKKMKGQKIDVKQLGFMVNNRPEQRDDIDRVPM